MNFKIQLLLVALSVSQCISIQQDALFKEIDRFFDQDKIAILQANPEPFTNVMSLTQGRSTSNSMKIHSDATTVLNALNQFEKGNYNDSVKELVMKNYEVPEPYCPERNYNYYQCNDKYPYRYFDGACNNLYVPWWGKKETPYSRILQPEYDDGYNSPKTKSVVKGYYLPNAREVALNIFRPHPSIADTTHLFLFFGQHVNHDLVFTGRSTYLDGKEKVCSCAEYKDPDCFPIAIPEDDYYNRDQQCFPFVRSSAAIEHFKCKFSYREQLNLVTHWLDNSPTYGSTLDEAELLRTYRYGLLKTSTSPLGSHDLPLKPGCSFHTYNECYMGGDQRMNDNLYLTMIDKIFVTEHNRIAEKLYELNPSWDDELIFQEARKINIGQYQHIIYWYYLPILLGSKSMKKWDLIPNNGYDFFNGYDKDLNPNVKNAFTIASRYGHTMINKFHYGYDNEYNLGYNRTTDFVLFSHTYYHNDVLRGSILQNSYYSSPAINNILNNYLFEGRSPHFKRLSLGSLNIQRGRDHGLPGYNKFRAWCGLNYAYSFDELTNIPEFIRNELKYLYYTVDDIDLFTGLTSEYSVEDGTVGHTAACIMGAGFRDWKFGDRFYYENNDSLTGFTSEQLYEIRKTTLARIICDNSDFYFIQLNPFLLANDETNPLVDCKTLPYINLNYWDY